MRSARACHCATRLSKWLWGSGQARRDHATISSDGPARLSTSPRPRHCPQPSEAEHGEGVAEQHVAADGHDSVALARSLACPQQNAIVRLIRCVLPHHPRSWIPERAQVARAAARAPLVPLDSETISDRGDATVFDHEDAACRSLLCPMHGVQLRPGREARRAD